MIKILDKKESPIGIVLYLNKFTFVVTNGLSFKSKRIYTYDNYTSYCYLGLHLMVSKNKGKGFRLYLFI